MVTSQTESTALLKQNRYFRYVMDLASVCSPLLRSPGVHALLSSDPYKTHG